MARSPYQPLGLPALRGTKTPSKLVSMPIGQLVWSWNIPELERYIGESYEAYQRRRCKMILEFLPPGWPTNTLKEYLAYLESLVMLKEITK